MDGINILDYLGKSTKSELNEEELSIFEETYQQALKFIEQEYEKYKKNNNQKLAQRYYMLLKYFLESKT